MREKEESESHKKRATRGWHEVQIEKVVAAEIGRAQKKEKIEENGGGDAADGEEDDGADEMMMS